MTYNITVKNKDALPIPYIIRVGDSVAAEALHSKQELMCDALLIGATNQSQFLIHCTKADYIFQPSPALEILFPALDKTPKPIHAEAS